MGFPRCEAMALTCPHCGWDFTATVTVKHPRCPKCKKEFFYTAGAPEYLTRCPRYGEFCVEPDDTLTVECHKCGKRFPATLP